MKIEIPVITADKFQEVVVQRILFENEHSNKTDIILNIMSSGFPKFDINNLDNFLKKLQNGFFISFDPVAVEFGESDMVWLVSGMNAILVTTNTLKTIDK